MKTLTRTLIAGLVTSVVLGASATSHAQVNARSLFNQVASSYQGKGSNGFQIRRVNNHVVKRHHGGGHHVITPPSHCHPKPPCHGGNYCPPPPPRVCYMYIVYRYDCHCGWKEYRSYGDFYLAENAVRHLQSQGYRAYMKKVAL